ncbi:MAG: FGGY family carbohydrate kinase [Candidatus Bathyarchaeia archaeon]
MGSEYLLGIDIGTLGCRCCIFDRSGRVKGYAYEEYEIESPKPDFAEQDPETYWKATNNTIRRALHESEIKREDIVAVGLTGIQVSFILIDKKGRCITPSIIYADVRSRKQCEWMRDQIGAREIYRITGSRLDPMYPASKLRWVWENQPEKLKNAFMILSPKDYVGFKFTGYAKMDAAMASTFQLLDIEKGTWSDKLIQTLGIPREIFPELISSTEILGEISGEDAKRLGLRKGTPIVIGGGDTTSMAFGAGLVSEEFVCGSLGTTSNLFGCLTQLRLDEGMRVSYYRHVVPGRYIVIAGTTDSLALRWYRDTLGYYEVDAGKKAGVSPYKIMDQEAERSPAGARGVILLPFLTGARSPLWNPDATGVLFGLRYHHKREDIVRAFLESVAYSIRQRIEVIKGLNLDPKEIRLIGGGAKSRLWNQIISDVTGMTISLLENEEAGVLGASLLAGIGVGAYKGFEEACEEAVRVRYRHYPKMKDRVAYDEMYKIYEHVYQSLYETFKTHIRFTKS